MLAEPFWSAMKRSAGWPCARRVRRPGLSLDPQLGQTSNSEPAAVEPAFVGAAPTSGNDLSAAPPTAARLVVTDEDRDSALTGAGPRLTVWDVTTRRSLDRF